jgi:hypothetical protein
VPKAVFGQEPQIKLPVGRHLVKGSFSWPVRPKTLTLPLGPILDISISGQTKGFPVLDENRNSGLVSLWLDDKPVPQVPTAPSQNELDQVSQNQLKVQIDRLLIDTQPLTVTTRVRLTVSGAFREELIKDVLLPDSTPTILASSVQTRLTGEGLRVQLSPGVHDLFIVSRLNNQVATLGPVGPLYGSETWTFVQQPKLRQVEISGAPQIDPSLVDLPWGNASQLIKDDDGKPLRLNLQSLPIYALEVGDSLSFQTLRRGDPEPGPDQLNLHRECWLDYTGLGLTCRDQLSATMRRNSFLAVESPFQLGQASLDNVPQVITWQIDSQGRKVPGLQLRQGSVSLAADLRLDDFTGPVPASGWDQNLSTTSQRFNLPPGYELFYVSGAKAFDQNGFVVSWWDRWTNLDLFIVLAIILTTFKLLGLRYAVLAALALAVSYQEYMAPRLIFLHVLGATALLSVLPKKGKARFITRSWRLIASIVLIITTVIFVIMQARVAIYPQLNPVYLSRNSYGFPITQYFGRNSHYFQDKDDYYSESDYAPASSAADESYPEASDFAVYEQESDEPQAPKPRERALSALALGQAATQPMQNSLIMTAPEAKAQNSVPRPSWTFRTVELDYNGQVAKDQVVNLKLIGPKLSSFLCILRLILMSWLVLAVISSRGAISFGGLLGKLLPKSKVLTSVTSLALALAFLLSAAALSTVGLSTAAQAQNDRTPYPPPEILKELQSRLLESNNSEPPGLPGLSISSPEKGLLRLSLEVENQNENIIFLPNLDPKVFQPTRLYTQDLGDLPILATKSGPRVALVPAGIRTIIFEGRLAEIENFQLSFPGQTIPGRVALDNLPKWSLAGLDQTGHPTGRSIFIYTDFLPKTEPSEPKENDSPESSSADPGQVRSGGQRPSLLTEQDNGQDALKPFFMVERTISLGIEWKIYTRVSTFNPIISPYVLTVPLLAGEKPTSASLTVKGGAAVLSFSPGTTQINWESDFDINLEKPIELKAENGLYTESWSLDAAKFWRVETGGLTPVYNVSPTGYWNPKWRPWSGETVTVSVSRPEAVPGSYLVVDQADLTVNVGQENRSNELKLTMRSSFGGPFSFDLPEGSEIQTLTLDHQNLPSSSLNGPKVVLPLTPGQHEVKVSWLETKSMTTRITTPKLNLDLSAANLEYSLKLPSDRWTLLTGGPVQGPAVLFWSFSGAILIFSLFLSRLKITPLGLFSWFLLFLGLSQFHTYGAFIVTGWLLVLGLRGKHKPVKSVVLFNFIQICLVIWTILALIFIYQGLRYGLLEDPAMRVTGYNSTDHNLNWFVDRATGDWPEAWVISIPDRIYRYIMLAWALWLAISLIRWLKWIWTSFSHEDFWRKFPPKPPIIQSQWPGGPPPYPGSVPPYPGPPPGPYPGAPPAPFPGPPSAPYPGAPSPYPGAPSPDLVPAEPSPEGSKTDED